MRVPKISYFICTTPRSGSTLLSEGLGGTGLAGHTTEWFFMLRDRGPDELRGIEDGGEYMKAFLAIENLEWLSDAFFRRYIDLCTDANGIFGVKMFWSEITALERVLRRTYSENTASTAALLDRLFPNLQYIYLERENVTRQAVSLVMARQTKSWSTRIKAEGTASFDFDLIWQMRSDLLTRAEQWRTFFEDNGIEPLRITYDQVVSDYPGAIRAVLDFLGIAIPIGFKLDQPATGVQGTSLNREWAERFDAELEARGPVAEPWAGPGSISGGTRTIPWPK